MKQIFEVFFSVVLMLVVVFLSAQGITTNTQISTAREYHNTVIERIENTGLSEDYVNSIVDYTNNNTDYTLTVKKVNGTDDTRSYNVSLKYPIKNVIYSVFGIDKKQTATIDGYASVGKSSPSTNNISEEKHGNVNSNIDLGNNITAKLYEDGYLIINGTGTEVTKDNTIFDAIKGKVTNIIITGNLENIPTEFFKDFSVLESVSFGNVKTIKTKAFSNCPKLKTVLLPKAVESVDNDTFTNCAELEYVYVNNSKDDSTISTSIVSNSPSFVRVVYLKDTTE